MGGEFAEAGGGVEGGVALVEEVVGGVIDIEEDGVEGAGGFLRVEAGGGVGGEGEEVGEDEVAAGIGDEAGAEGDEAGLVPVDDGGHELDDVKGGDAGVIEDGGGGVAEAEATDDDAEVGGF